VTLPKRKLIEVALPLEAINKASAREKSIRHGHPSTLHLWWARRPLAAARAVIFSQMVDDPSGWPDLFPTEKAQEKERQRLFRVIADLMLWENTTNEAVLQRARDGVELTDERSLVDPYKDSPYLDRPSSLICPRGVGMLTSKLTSKSQTTIPQAVRVALGLRPGDEILYRIDDGQVILAKARSVQGDDPFKTFDEWDSEADRHAYADL
jgi:AbrB family looped-hinge helix DNA binding protein